MKQTKNQDSQEETAYTIQDMFDSLEITGVLNEDITNKECALIMAKHETKQENLAGVELYKGMALAQEKIEKFFDNMPDIYKQGG